MFNVQRSIVDVLYILNAFIVLKAILKLNIVSDSTNKNVNPIVKHRDEHF